MKTLIDQNIHFKGIGLSLIRIAKFIDMMFRAWPQNVEASKFSIGCKVAYMLFVFTY